MKIDDPFNYALFKNLNDSVRNKNYNLRSVDIACANNIGNYEKQYPYKETLFYLFDMFLFSEWCAKPNGQGKDKITYGVDV